MGSKACVGLTLTFKSLSTLMVCPSASVELIRISHFDRLIKQYGAEAGIHPDKLHMHSLKHSVAMLPWDTTGNLGQLQSYLGHKAASSTLIYLAEADARKAHAALAGITL